MAVVVLALAATGLLEVFQLASSSAVDARQWVTAAAYAEQGVEAAKIGAGAVEDARRLSLEEGFSRKIESRAAGAELYDVTVTIGLPRGGQFVVHRLIPSS